MYRQHLRLGQTQKNILFLLLVAILTVISLAACDVPSINGNGSNNGVNNDNGNYNDPHIDGE